MGQIADLKAKEVGVSADEAGTEMMYGGRRARPCVGSGSDGGSIVSALVQMRKDVEESFCLRMRLR